MRGGTTYIQTVTCLDCGFKWNRSMTCWGDCDFEDEKVHSKDCIFCQHAKKLGIPLKQYIKKENKSKGNHV